ncbi:DUF3138 family protein [Vogesella sp. LIG4]|uniref:DUF3138 family protein n=1 Tax=Vogesella sp. LIG4 TaxID=1192162 RepID=UPI00081FB48D|nr:DUF3138 family protein [Vogesella sp. LIG4]SCK28006.1 Protein of unknown function [Vogesella sp. LIG4]
MKRLISIAVIAALPQIASADAAATDNEMAARLDAMQRKIDALESALKNTGITTSDQQSRDDETEDIKQRLNKQELLVQSLTDAANTGPIAGLSVTGYIDPVYIYNRNAKTSGFSFMNHANNYTYFNSSIGDVFLDIKKTFGTGPTAPFVDIQLEPNRGAGNVTLDGAAGGGIFNTAQVTFPLDETNQFVAGLMPGLSGYEYQSSNQFPTLTHNLLYDFSAPGYFAGVGYNGSTASGDYSWKVLLGNEQNRTHPNSVLDANGGSHSNRNPTLAWRIDKVKGLWDWGWSAAVGKQSVYTGNAQNSCQEGSFGLNCLSNSPFTPYMYTEFDASYVAADFTFNAELDLGRQKSAAWNGGDADWWGFSLLALRKWRFEPLGLIGSSLRFDYLDTSRNGGGAGTTFTGGSALDGMQASAGTDGVNGFGIAPSCLASSPNNGLECRGARRQDIALDFMLYPTSNVTVKFEYRHDWADLPVFQKSDGSWSKSNDVIGSSFIYSF